MASATDDQKKELRVSICNSLSIALFRGSLDVQTLRTNSIAREIETQWIHGTNKSLRQESQLLRPPKTIK
eukprot:6106937-Amphidinium_carterae.1